MVATFISQGLSVVNRITRILSDIFLDERLVFELKPAHNVTSSNVTERAELHPFIGIIVKRNYVPKSVFILELIFI